MNAHHEPLPTNSRSSEPERGGVLDGQPTEHLQKSLAENALQSTIGHGENQPLDVATALLLLYKETGFYGRNNEEKNSMQAIMGRSTSGFPTLRYFDEVEYHQRKADTRTPTAALRSLVDHFESYAVQANTEVRFSRMFVDTITRLGVNMDSTLAECFTQEDLLYDEPTRRTLVSIARLHEVDLFVKGEAKNPLGVKAGIDSLKEKAFYNRLFELLEGMKFSEIMSLNERMIGEENERFEYWKDRLKEAHMRGFLKTQVDAALENLNTLRPTISS